MRRGLRRGAAALLGVVMALMWAVPAQADAIREKQWHLKYLKITEAHRISQGEGVTVGVVDSGVDGLHPDLSKNLVAGINVIGSKPANQDDDGHGTAMAGLIAAHGRGSSGILGIAPKAKIVPIRIIEGPLKFGYKLEDGIRWGAAHGVKVLSISIGGGNLTDLKAAVTEALARDVVLVASTGNEGLTSVEYPAAYPGVLAVGGTDQNGDHEPTSATGAQIGISAPGTEVWSADLGGKYRFGTGTSDSTAIVAGVAALVRSKYPELSAAQVIEHLKATAVDKGPVGWDKEFGAGIVDPVAALTTKPSPSSAAASPSEDPVEDGDESSSNWGPEHVQTLLLRLLCLAVCLAVVGGTVVVIVVLVRRKRR